MSKREYYCPLCNSENIAVITEDHTGYNRADESFVIKDYEYTECLDCQENFVTNEQARRNEDKLAPLAQW